MTGRRRLWALVAMGTLLAADLSALPAPESAVISGPYARLLAASTDLGESRGREVRLTVSLADARRPEELIEWSRARGLRVRWRPGDDWAVVEGEATGVARAFGVPVHDYRGRRGQVFYASPRQPAVPEELTRSVSDTGRILGYTPHHMARPDLLPMDVPRQGLGPDALLTAYNAHPLAAAGFTGAGATLVIFGFDGFAQSDLDSFADSSALPRFTPVVIGGRPGPPGAETTMDLQVAHAIAPDAQLVVVNARPTVEGDGGYEKVGRLFEDTARQFPGAVWSLSIGWGCDRLPGAADLAPVRTALVAAQRTGTAVFDASGDNGGLECKGGPDWSAPPGPDDIGLDAVASLPEVTSVGGTTLSTDAQGQWLAEQAWVDVPMSLGSSGGISKLFPRPAFQASIQTNRYEEKRLVPDVAALADPFTGVRIVLDGQPRIGAGTSQAAPIWAALTVLMNQYLQAHGGRLLGGDLNPLLYQVASGARLPGFRDVRLGSNAVDVSTPGYDLVTGLGSPNVDNLVRDLLAVQTGAARR
ncbi:peptidase S53 [Mycolicibacterium cosmeticum]|uniref:Kumamolisin n=1 Tax=Mycolicibacterium cosmeticum TaxID=258533 RepID=W9AN21_MYCCO|nr:S53 family peptidase [Mycolicibacterium cosmeticum]TLH68051.1 peptidase S53 [Mycolicibacterium cosmeticum]CDO06883.1 kumamolisin [Mycolicibacterium cosmeticum]